MNFLGGSAKVLLTYCTGITMVSDKESNAMQRECIESNPANH